MPIPHRGYFYCAFPYLDADNDSISLGPLVLHHRRKILSTGDVQGYLLQSMDLFRSHTGKPLEAGFYAALSYTDWEGPHRDLALRVIVDLIRYSVLYPGEFINPEFSYTDFYTTYPVFETGERPVFAGWRNFDQWMPPTTQDVTRQIYPPFQLMHPSRKIPQDTQEEVALLERLFDTSLEFEGSKDILNRLLLAIRWYNASFKDIPSVSGNSLVCMAIAYETLFDSPAESIQAALAQDLRFLFFGNQYVQDWIRQFYDARSRVVHRGYTSDLSFRVDKQEHLDLVYWARVIFRMCIRTLLHQREEIAQSQLVHAFVPNSKRLRKIAGILRSQDLDFAGKMTRTPLLKEIEHLTTISFDYGSESNYSDISFIGHALLTELVASASPESGFDELAQRIIDEGVNWHETSEGRQEVCALYDQLEEALGVEMGQGEPANELIRALYRYVGYVKNFYYIDG